MKKQYWNIGLRYKFLFYSSAPYCAYVVKVIREPSLATTLKGVYFIFYIFLE
jgi:hypothetical protein